MGFLRSNSLKKTGLAAEILTNAPLAFSFLVTAVTWNALPQADEIALKNADAIIVFTGGKGRVQAAFELATDAEQVVISGANPETWLSGDNVTTLSSAINTRGNALETAWWSRQNDVKNVVIVTSDYHAVRSYLETRDALPKGINISFHTVQHGINSKMWLLETLKTGCRAVAICDDYFTKPPLRYNYPDMKLLAHAIPQTRPAQAALGAFLPSGAF